MSSLIRSLTCGKETERMIIGLSKGRVEIVTMISVGVQISGDLI